MGDGGIARQLESEFCLDLGNMSEYSSGVGHLSVTCNILRISPAQSLPA